MFSVMDIDPVNSLKNNIQMDQKGQFLFTIWFGNALTSTALPSNYHFKMCSGDRYIHACIDPHVFDVKQQLLLNINY